MTNGFNFYMPVRIISGSDCVKKNAALFRKTALEWMGARGVGGDTNEGANSAATAADGKPLRAFIVTGKHSAVESGALCDVIAALSDSGDSSDAPEFEWTQFDKITENPLIEVCHEGGKLAADYGAELVIGIGGGSALDAAKAIAAFAANPEIAPEEIYNVSALKMSLPIIAVPTTSGTGSEVNPYSILTLGGSEAESGKISSKKTFNSVNSYPKYAFLDAKYTATLGERYTVSTALDAICHCVESYMSPKSTELSMLYAKYGAKAIYEVMCETASVSVPSSVLFPLSTEQREKLLYASAAGGLAINTTGTGFPHPLGYNLTFGRNVPHGAACAVFMRQFLAYTSKSDEGKKRVAELMRALQTDEKTFAETVCGAAESVAGKLKLTDAEIEIYIAQTRTASNYKNNFYVINEDEMRQIYRSLGEGYAEYAAF